MRLDVDDDVRLAPFPVDAPGQLDLFSVHALGTVELFPGDAARPLPEPESSPGEPRPLRLSLGWRVLRSVVGGSEGLISHSKWGGSPPADVDQKWVAMPKARRSCAMS